MNSTGNNFTATGFLEVKKNQKLKVNVPKSVGILYLLKQERILIYTCFNRSLSLSSSKLSFLSIKPSMNSSFYCFIDNSLAFYLPKFPNEYPPALNFSHLVRLGSSSTGFSSNLFLQLLSMKVPLFFSLFILIISS